MPFKYNKLINEKKYVPVPIGVLLLLFIFPPVGIYMILRHPTVSKGGKVLATLIGCFFLFGILDSIFNDRHSSSSTVVAVRENDIYCEEQKAFVDYVEQVNAEVEKAQASQNSIVFEEALKKRENDKNYDINRVTNWGAIVNSVGGGSYGVKDLDGWIIHCTGYRGWHYNLYIDIGVPKEEIKKLSSGTKIRFSGDNGNRMCNYTNVSYNIIE